MGNIGVNLKNVQLKASLNDKTLNNVEIKELKDNISLDDAEKRLNSPFGDGFDTIGFSIEDKNYIAYGKGLSAKAGDKISFGGKTGQVKFFEDESNSMKEGIKSLSPSGVLKTIGVGGAIIGLSAGGYAGGSAAVAAGYGKEILRISTKSALIGATAIATTILVGSTLASKYISTNESKIKELTK